jgi:hypothetical protein
MSKNLIAANVLLLIVAGLLGWQLRQSILRFNAENDIAKFQPVRDPKSLTVDQGLAVPKPIRQYNSGEFDVIAAQNLFSETRAREEKTETAAQAAPESPPLDVKPVLVGITISGAQRQALIIDPSSSKEGKKTQRRKLGDSFRGYTITDIAMNQMVLQRGNRREVIPLFDGAKHPTGGKTAIVATRVVAFGPGGSGAGGVVGGAPSGQSPARVAGAQPAGSNVAAIGGSAQSSASQGSQSSTARSQQQPSSTRQSSGSQSANPAWNERTDDQGRRVIRTPFGDIVRPDKPNNP